MKAHIYLLARVKRLSQALTLNHAVATGIVQSLVLACMTVFSSTHAWAEISFVKTIGTTSTKTNGTSTLITVPAPDVAAAHRVIIAFASDPVTTLFAFTAFTRVTGDGFYIDSDRGKVQVTIRTQGVSTALTIFKNDMAVLAQTKSDWRSIEIERTINEYFSRDDVATGCRVRVHYILPVPLNLELLCN